jgi:hypothetical protein
VFVTLDKNLEFQQNLKHLKVGLVVLHSRSNRIADLSSRLDALQAAVRQVRTGQVLHANE